MFIKKKHITTEVTGAVAFLICGVVGALVNMDKVFVGIVFGYAMLCVILAYVVDVSHKIDNLAKPEGSG